MLWVFLDRRSELARVEPAEQHKNRRRMVRAACFFHKDRKDRKEKTYVTYVLLSKILHVVFLDIRTEEQKKRILCNLWSSVENITCCFF